MRNFTQTLLVCVFVIFVVEILVFAPEEINVPKVVKAPESQTETRPEQSMVGVHLVETKDGHKEWELWAEEASGSREKGNWILKIVKVQVFSDQGFNYTVTGNTGRVLADNKDLEIEGHVITKSSNGYVFETEKIVYVSATKLLNSPGKVNMRGPAVDDTEGRLELKGLEMVASLKESTINILHEVEAYKKVSESQVIAIKSQTAKFSSVDLSASFQGNVVVESEGTRVSGPRAKFNFGRVGPKIQSLVVDGGVKLSDVDRWATAERVDMLFSEDKFILKGAPRVVQNSDELTGEEIVYSRGGKVITVNSVKARFDEEDDRGKK